MTRACTICSIPRCPMSDDTIVGCADLQPDYNAILDRIERSQDPTAAKADISRTLTYKGRKDSR